MTTFANEHECDECHTIQYGDSFLPIGWVVLVENNEPKLLCRDCAKL